MLWQTTMPSTADGKRPRGWASVSFYRSITQDRVDQRALSQIRQCDAARSAASGETLYIRPPSSDSSHRQRSTCPHATTTRCLHRTKTIPREHQSQSCRLVHSNQAPPPHARRQKAARFQARRSPLTCRRSLTFTFSRILRKSPRERQISF